VEPVVGDERLQVAAGVRDEAELEPPGPQVGERRQDVLEDLEVVRVLPGARHLDGALVRPVGVAAHAADDLLREEHPDLLVVVELRVPLEGPHGMCARLTVALGIEIQAEPLAEAPVALGTQIRARLGDREVDVEENCSQRHGPACSSTVGCVAWRGFRRPRIMCARSRHCATAIFHCSSAAKPFR
jgi:hypothetical protein